MATRILLVEDNPGDAVIFREKLNASDLDYELVHAKRLSEGLEQLEGGHFDIMMVDLSLPDAHGMEAVIKVREAAPNHPLIVLTGLDDATAAAEAKQEGAVDYLVKWYVDSVSLARYIRYAVAQYRMKDKDASAASTPSSASSQTSRTRPVEVEGTVVASPAKRRSSEQMDEEGRLPDALEAASMALLIVDDQSAVVFANKAARVWVEGKAYPWTLAEGVQRIPRKAQSLEQHAARTTWEGRAAWLVTLRPARPEPRSTPAPKADSPPEAAPVTTSSDASSTSVDAAAVALGFIEQAQRQSAWLADVLRSALEADRTPEPQPDLVDVLALVNQVVRDERDLAMALGLPLRVSSDRKKVMAYADKNIVNRLVQRLVVDAVHDARQDGVHLRVDVDGEVSVIETKWYSAAEGADNGQATLGRRLVERLTEQADGAFAHDHDVTGQHTLTVQLPGRPGA